MIVFLLLTCWITAAEHECDHARDVYCGASNNCPLISHLQEINWRWPKCATALLMTHWTCSQDPLETVIKRHAVNNNITVLVTGGAGFIGSHVAQFCLDVLKFKVVVVDDLSGGYEANVPEGAIFVEANLYDAGMVARIFKDHGPFTYIYHLAAYAAEGLSHFIRCFNYENNLVASTRLLNAALLQQPFMPKAFVFTSSIATYGTVSAKHMPIREFTRQNPEDPYGISKLAFEMDLKAAHEMWGINYVIFRPHNVYGPKQNIADKFRNVIGIFMNQLLHDENMTIFGDGQQTRAFSYIDDVAPVIAASVLFPAAYQQDFLVGSDDFSTVSGIAEQVARAMNKPHSVNYLPARKEVVDAYANHDKVRCYFHPPAPVPIAKGITLMAAFVQFAYAAGMEFIPTGYNNIEVTNQLVPSWKSWLTSRTPRKYLLVIPGLTEETVRLELVKKNLRTKFDWSQWDCLIWQYKPRSQWINHQDFIPCRFRRRVGQMWAEAIKASWRWVEMHEYQYIATLLDDVEIGDDFDMPAFLDFMRRNQIGHASPTVLGSHWPQMNSRTRHSSNGNNTAGWLTTFIEFQFNVWNREAYQCLAHMIEPDINSLGYGYDFCIPTRCPHVKQAMVDTMTAHHRATKTSYDTQVAFKQMNLYVNKYHCRLVSKEALQNYSTDMELF